MLRRVHIFVLPAGEQVTAAATSASEKFLQILFNVRYLW
jgi:hypothetical protein